MGHAKLVTEDFQNSYPDFLKKVADDERAPINQPIIVKMGDAKSEAQLKELVQKHPISKIIDNYGEQFAELVLSKNAHLYAANHSVQVSSIAKTLDEHFGKTPSWKVGSWVYFPWNGQLVHLLDEQTFYELRTIRNKDLITTNEQVKLRDFTAACFGMSVGSASALGLAISGMSQRIKLIDGAVISGSNLNRIMTGVASVGTPKAHVIGRKIYEMNPYNTVHYFDKVTADNIASIFDAPDPVKVAVDEIDDLAMKIQIRIEAKKRGIPVVMATELADSVMIDVERYDLDPNYDIFHGLVPGIEGLLTANLENRREWMKKAVKIIGPHNMPIRMQESLLKIGSTIVTHPQLGSTVMITGGVIATVVKYIALDMQMQSGRYMFSLENNLLKDHKTRAHRKNHKKHTKIINSALESM